MAHHDKHRHSIFVPTAVLLFLIGAVLAVGVWYLELAPRGILPLPTEEPVGTEAEGEVLPADPFAEPQVDTDRSKAPAEVSAKAGEADAGTAEIEAEAGEADAETAEAGAETGEADAEAATTDAATGKEGAGTAKADAKTDRADAEAATTDAATGKEGAGAVKADAEAGEADAEVATTDAATGKEDTGTAKADATTDKSDAEAATTDAATGKEGTGTDKTDAKTDKAGAETAKAGAKTDKSDAGKDTEPPVITGVKDTAVVFETAFDPLEGVAVSDDEDPAPQLTVEPAQVDTSSFGIVHLTYTATDAAGNTSTAERDVIVCEETAEYDGAAYPIHWDTTGIEGQPYLVTVNRTKDCVTVYEQDEDGRYTVPFKAFPCSTGYRTPSGYYRTLERYRWRYLYEDCWGQYATRITGHILFHSVPYYNQDPSTLEYEEYNLLGTPASLGSIRLKVEDVKWIYDNCPDGFSCVIYDDELTPGPLGKPEAAKIDPSDERRGWDPTDPDPASPWNS